MNLAEIIEGIKKQDLRVLSKAITLSESKKREHQKIIEDLISSHKPHNFSKIIGISGLPGVGKSTFINRLVLDLLTESNKVAVLAVDPSSSITGGSILGDKTRMQDISAKKNVFIRPSPTDNFLGGVAAKTFEAIKICELFGFEYILVETVGVGQSESLVSQMVDFFILMIAPNTGDDLQGMKRGVLELADLLIINKADGERIEDAKNTLNLYNQSYDLIAKNKQDFAQLSSIKHSLKPIIEKMNNHFSAISLSTNRVDDLRNYEKGKISNLVSQKLNSYFQQNSKYSLAEFKNYLASLDHDL